MATTCTQIYAIPNRKRQRAECTPSNTTPTRQAPKVTPSWALAYNYMDTYGKNAVEVLKEMSNVNMRCIVEDYALSISKETHIDFNEIATYRYNSINWACSYYESHRMSMGTHVAYTEMFDMYFSLAVLQRKFGEMQNLFAHNWLKILFSIMITKLTMEVNEDNCISMTKTDVNRLLQQTEYHITTSDFIKCEIQILGTLNFALWNARSPKSIFEVFVSCMPRLIKYSRTEDQILFPFYCRYIYDIIQLDYTVVSTVPLREVIACVFYLARLHWPTNGYAIYSYNEAQLHKPIQLRKPNFNYTFQDYRGVPRPTWSNDILKPFNVELPCVNETCSFMLGIINKNTNGRYYGDSMVAKRYESTDTGMSHQIGFPSVVFFEQNKIK